MHVHDPHSPVSGVVAGSFWKESPHVVCGGSIPFVSLMHCSISSPLFHSWFLFQPLMALGKDSSSSPVATPWVRLFLWPIQQCNLAVTKPKLVKGLTHLDCMLRLNILSNYFCHTGVEAALRFTLCFDTLPNVSEGGLHKSHPHGA